MENTWSPFAHGTCARIDHHLPPLRALGVRDDVHGFVPMVLHLLGLPDTASPEVRGLLRLLFLWDVKCPPMQLGDGQDNCCKS